MTTKQGVRCCLVLLAILLASGVVSAQVVQLQLAVTDENGIAVSGAIAQLQGTVSARCETDHSGRCVLRAPGGSYRITVNKDGFYTLTAAVSLPGVSHLDLTLSHVQEIKESVDVVASTPQVDPAQVANTQSLDSQEIVNVPYPTTRDIRQLLEFVPGVVRDTSGQAHVAGGSTYQTLNTLDGFDITNPAFGTLDLRFSSDAIRAIDVQESRYSAEFGKASAGVIDFVTRSGDDRLRFNATNFIPSFQTKKGLNFDKWTPRATLSGPIKKGRAWFLLAPDGEYDHNLVKELPSGADTNVVWRASNLAKVQVNLTQSNVFTGSFLINHQHSDYDGLSLLNPKQTTLIQAHDVYFGSIKDQQYFRNGTLFEIGAAVDSYHDAADPLGDAPYVLSPGHNEGNFFESFHGHSRRIEGITNLYLPPQHLAGTHEIRLGVDADRRDNDERFVRRDITIVRADGTRFSQIVYSCGAVPCAPGVPSMTSFTQNDVEVGGYVQDRWSPGERLLVQPGVRFDHESFTDRTVISPRLGVTYMLPGDTKLSAGVGVFYDTANLEKIGRALQGERFQYTYDPTGTLLVGSPLPTTFAFQRSTLQLPRFLNWSIGLERRMPSAVFISVQYMQRDGSRIFAYQDLSTTPLVGNYLLGNTRADHYRALQVSARRHFNKDYEIFLAYTRSRSRTNQVIDPTLDNPVFSAQAPGPLPWDTPNSMVGWGFLPVPFTKKWDVAWSFDWRTGFPFSVVNQNQEIVGPPDSRRFPDYFSLNLFLERRFTFRNLNLALRGGFEDITGRSNPFIVDNNIDSPTFLQFEAWTGRSFTARIRFLGRKK